MTVFLLYHLSLAVFADRRLALLAAVILAVVPVDVIGSRYFKEDIPLMFFTSLSLFMMIRLLKNPSARNYLLTGVAIGLATATKYASVMLLVFLVLAHAVAVVQHGGQALLRKILNPYFFLSLACAAVVFLVLNPYVIIEWDAFCSQLGKQIKYSARGHSGTRILARDFWWCFYLAYAIVPGLSLPVTLTALAGMIWSTVRKNIRAVFIGVWALFFYFCMESSPAKPFPFFARYLHPLFPCLCMFSAFAFIFLFDNLCKTTRSRRLMTALIAVCLLCPLGKTALINASLSKDTRIMATEWINENLEQDATIGIDSPVYGPRPSRHRFTVFHKERLYGTSFEDLEENNTDYVVLNNFKSDRFNYCYRNSEHAQQAYLYYRELEDRYELVKEIRPAFKLQSYGFHNPIISIYKVRTPSAPTAL
jgi:4-amino-4-deoxy-L-arabinose transferase-like glycosyltransferase